MIKSNFGGFSICFVVSPDVGNCMFILSKAYCLRYCLSHELIGKLKKKFGLTLIHLGASYMRLDRSNMCVHMWTLFLRWTFFCSYMHFDERKLLTLLSFCFQYSRDPENWKVNSLLLKWMQYHRERKFGNDDKQFSAQILSVLLFYSILQ